MCNYLCVYIAYNNQNPIGFKLFTKLRLSLSRLNEYEFKHN